MSGANHNHAPPTRWMKGATTEPMKGIVPLYIISYLLRDRKHPQVKKWLTCWNFKVSYVNAMRNQAGWPELAPSVARPTVPTCVFLPAGLRRSRWRHPTWPKRGSAGQGHIRSSPTEILDSRTRPALLRLNELSSSSGSTWASAPEQHHLIGGSSYCWAVTQSADSSEGDPHLTEVVYLLRSTSLWAASARAGHPLPSRVSPVWGSSRSREACVPPPSPAATWVAPPSGSPPPRSLSTAQLKAMLVAAEACAPGQDARAKFTHLPEPDYSGGSPNSNQAQSQG
jgi:hypothetical protein